MTIRGHRNSMMLYSGNNTKATSHKSSPSEEIDSMPLFSPQNDEATHGEIVLCFDPSGSEDGFSELEVGSPESFDEEASSGIFNEWGFNPDVVGSEKANPTPTNPRPLSTHEKEALISDVRTKGNLLEEYMFLRGRKSAQQVYERYARVGSRMRSRGKGKVEGQMWNNQQQMQREEKVGPFGGQRRGFSGAVLERGVRVGGI